MPFNLKNHTTTYQQAMSIFFYDQMYMIMDICIDDMLIKRKTREDYSSIFTQVFDRLIQYKFLLNLQKCVFEVESPKLLEFIVNDRAIIDMPPLNTLKELRNL